MLLWLACSPERPDLLPGGGSPARERGASWETAAPTETGETSSECPPLVINELNGEGDDDWVEIHNGNGEAVDLSSYALYSGYDALDHEAVLSGSIAAGDYAVVGTSAEVTPDVELDLYLGTASTGADAVQLQCGGVAIDTVAYAKSTYSDTDTTWASLEECAASYATYDSSGTSMSRTPDLADTSACAADFGLIAPTPGAENVEADTDTDTDTDADSDTDADTDADADCSVTSGITINEVDAKGEDGNEWLEIYNDNDGDTVNLSGWTIYHGKSKWESSFATLSGSVGPKDYFLVGYSDVSPDYEVTGSELDLGDASDADVVQLRCGDVAVDTVAYAKSTYVGPDATWEALEECATSYATMNDADTSMSRTTDGADTSDCAVDFALAEKTPGQPNAVDPPCVATGSGDLRINEVLFDAEGAESDSANWVELYNAGQGTLTLNKFEVQANDSDGAFETQFTFGAASLEPGGFVVVSTMEMDVDAEIADDLDLQGGPDGVAIVDCEGTWLDTVLWGDAPLDGLVDENGSDAVVDPADPGMSLGRFPDGVDSDDITDWYPYSTPTPGAPNEATESTEDGGGISNPSKCGERPSSPDRPEGAGCTTVLPLGGLEAALAALVLRRRRAGASRAG